MLLAVFNVVEASEFGAATSEAATKAVGLGVATAAVSPVCAVVAAPTVARASVCTPNSPELGP